MDLPGVPFWGLGKKEKNTLQGGECSRNLLVLANGMGRVVLSSLLVNLYSLFTNMTTGKATMTLLQNLTCFDPELTAYGKGVLSSFDTIFRYRF